MIADTLARLHRYAALHPAFARAFELLEQADLGSLEPGRHAIDGDRLYVSIEHIDGRGRRLSRYALTEDCRLEIEDWRLKIGDWRLVGGAWRFLPARG